LLLLALLLAPCSAQVVTTKATLVRDATQLHKALERGNEHIQIINHLDLRGLPAHPFAEGEEIFRPSPATLSITVCSSFN
jgi:hypothetical protein